MKIQTKLLLASASAIAGILFVNSLVVRNRCSRAQRTQ